MTYMTQGTNNADQLPITLTAKQWNILASDGRATIGEVEGETEADAAEAWAGHYGQYARYLSDGRWVRCNALGQQVEAPYHVRSTAKQ